MSTSQLCLSAADSTEVSAFTYIFECAEHTLGHCNNTNKLMLVRCKNCHHAALEKDEDKLLLALWFSTHGHIVQPCRVKREGGRKNQNRIKTLKQSISNFF